VIPILTQREEEILSLIATGKTAKEIGDSLFISPHTAQRHRKNILKKLGLKGTAELVRYYLESMN
ncbi:partial Spore germination protein GerE, partial [uncultured bacterium]